MERLRIMTGKRASRWAVLFVSMCVLVAIFIDDPGAMVAVTLSLIALMMLAIKIDRDAFCLKYWGRHTTPITIADDADDPDYLRKKIPPHLLNHVLLVDLEDIDQQVDQVEAWLEGAKNDQFLDPDPDYKLPVTTMVMGDGIHANESLKDYGKRLIAHLEDLNVKWNLKIKEGKRAKGGRYKEFLIQQRHVKRMLQ